MTAGSFFLRGHCASERVGMLQSEKLALQVLHERFVGVAKRKCRFAGASLVREYLAKQKTRFALANRAALHQVARHTVQPNICFF